LVGRVAMQTEATFQLLEKFDVEYQRLKYSHRAMRFEDVTRRVGDIRSLVDEGRLSFRLDSRIDHLLLDEFQDTSPRQWRVLRPLSERVSSGAGDTSFFCVGDVKQAIYGWRGGVAEIFDAIDRQLDDLKQESLNISFRCSQPVIDTVNRVFDGISKHPSLGRAENAVRRWCDRFKRHETAKRELAGYVELLTSPRPVEGETQRDITIGFAARRIAEVVAEVPSERLLVFEAREGWQPLCEFLGVDVPEGEPFPHVNDSAAFVTRTHQPMDDDFMRNMVKQ